MRTRSFSGPQMRTKGSRGALNRLANVVDQPFDELRVVAFGHYADQRLGPRLADDQPTAALELGFGGGYPLLDAIGFERSLAAVEPDVLEKLRYWVEQVQDLARRLAAVD